LNKNKNVCAEGEVAAAAQLFFADLLTDLRRLQTALATRTTHFSELLDFVVRRRASSSSALPLEAHKHALSRSR
jgi:hypothetical protein